MTSATAPRRRPKPFIQTEQETHKDLAVLAQKNPKALGLMHAMLYNMQRSNVLAVSHATLSQIAGCSVRTITRSIPILEEAKLIQTINIGPAGSVKAYVINAKVAWMKQRKGIKYALFNANILVSSAEQPDTRIADDTTPLKPIPRLELLDTTGAQPFLDETEEASTQDDANELKRKVG